MKIYKSEASAKRAVKNQGLYRMNYEIVPSPHGYRVVFYVHDSDDADDIRGRGFGAWINPDKAA